MADLNRLDDGHLGAALRALGPALEMPRVDVAATVLRAIGDTGTVRRRPSRLPRPRLVVAVALAVSLLAGAAVASTIGVPGIRLWFTDAPTTTPSHLLIQDPAFLGPVTTLEAAEQAVGRPLLLPSGAGLTELEVHLAEDGRVSLVYAAGEQLPEIGDSGVGLVITEFRGSVGRDLMSKLIADGVAVTTVAIGSVDGWWVEGPHAVLVHVPGGDVQEIHPALSGDALLLTLDGLTVRLESAAGLERTAQIAGTLSLR